MSTMLVSETPVQVSQEGRSIAAGEVEAEDLIVDGLTGSYTNVSISKRRRVNTATFPKFVPVKIRRGALGRGFPIRDIQVSPHQMLLASVRHGNGPGQLREVSANYLLASGIGDSAKLGTVVEYVALIFERPCFISCAGVLMRGHTLGASKWVSEDSHRGVAYV